MGHRKQVCGWFILFFFLMAVPAITAENDDLRYFLAKASSKEVKLSKKEKEELLSKIEAVLQQTQLTHMRLVEAIQIGEFDFRYQEGKFWMSKLEQGPRRIEEGLQQVQSLKEKPASLVPALKLYKILKDLSSDFNACNNNPSFSAMIGDLAPEMELWADPVFYQLYLIPLAQSKDTEKRPIPPEKKPTPKEKPTSKEKKP